VRPQDMLSSEVSGTHLCNYSLVGCDVAHVWMIIMVLILEVQGILGF